MSLADQIKMSFWESRGLDFPRGVFAGFPTMLTLEEMRMLFAIASHQQLPSGDIADLGSFLGGSSISLAAGARSSAEQRTVHSYDRFKFNRAVFTKYLSQHPQRESLRSLSLDVELWKALTASYQSELEVHPGDVTAQTPPSSIALCFIDLDKSFALNEYLLRNYFDKLVPNAIVVQQDFFFAKTPWTIVTMHRLESVLPFRGATREHSAIFELTGALTPETIDQAVARGMTIDDVEAGYRHFIELAPRTRQAEVLQLAWHRFQQSPDVQTTHDYPNGFSARAFYRQNFRETMQ